MNKNSFETCVFNYFIEGHDVKLVDEKWNEKYAAIIYVTYPYDIIDGEICIKIGNNIFYIEVGMEDPVSLSRYIFQDDKGLVLWDSHNYYRPHHLTMDAIVGIISLQKYKCTDGTFDSCLEGIIKYFNEITQSK